LNYLDYILKNDPLAKTKRFEKGDVLQRQGEKDSKSYFVIKGLLRSYIIDQKGKEHIFHFAAENWVVADLESQEFENPTELFIDCVEDSEVTIFRRECMVNSNKPGDLDIEDVSMLYRRIGVLQRRVLMLMSSSASERYTHFIQTYPELPNRVPQHMIASYLGITPQALSTIRRHRVSNS
jgi:CRP-like cAMP-binding protein